MITVVRAAMAGEYPDRDMLYANAIAGVVVIAASAMLIHYGSFARALAAAGL